LILAHSRVSEIGRKTGIFTRAGASYYSMLVRWLLLAVL
jgi:hypothetical protein